MPVTIPENMIYLNPKDFTIRVASAAQAKKHIDASWEAGWALGMNREQLDRFYAKEAQSEWYKNYMSLKWVLVRKDDFDGEPLSFVETHRHQALLKPKSTVSSAKGVFYNITAVVTSVAHRKKGYATYLMKLLHYILLNPTSPGEPPSHIPAFPSEWGSPPPPVPDHLIQHIPRPIASILWADIPISFYEKCTIGNKLGTGYNYFKSSNQACTFDLLHTEHQKTNTEWDIVYPKDIEEITRLLLDSNKKMMNDSDDSAKGSFTQDPSTPGALTYIATRASFVETRAEWAKEIPPDKYPLGVRSKNVEGENTIVLFALESFDLGRKFLITEINNLRSEQVGSLLMKLDEINSDITGGRYSKAEFWGIDNDSIEWFDKFREECKGSGRNLQTSIRSGVGHHVLGVCNYTNPGEDALKMVDNQMWNWC
ncbi:uncharacterized protein I206_100136 [Kwoniella pini CBS 10737]|uniref:N-acetyltransferase domain-containing protein n=1 Tax=Kwoniella pini CBS 10737 TaxID=1296096 RepID=A0A1B9IEM4_9TREE|nr:uncharacterized protein I206_01191 [Kwoniella pini CBS 10737]OCF53884.1 hypothetical protein I206_01191 [Kwoniella pini CBS 10737]